MGWRRLPTYLVNFPLRLMPLTPKQRQALETTGHVSEVAFKTIPSVGKVRAGPGGVPPARPRDLPGRSMRPAAGPTARPRRGRQLEIKEYLEKVYGLCVGSVRTLNYEGRKKRRPYNGKQYHIRRTDYKKAYVSLLPPRPPGPAPGA